MMTSVSWLSFLTSFLFLDVGCIMLKVVFQVSVYLIPSDPTEQREWLTVVKMKCMVCVVLLTRKERGQQQLTVSVRERGRVGWWLSSARDI